MDAESGKRSAWRPSFVLLRFSALLATSAAALIMGLNRQSKTTVVAVIGTTPISQTFTAKFQDTPAFMYFVAANAIASGYNLLVLLFRLFTKSKSFDITVHLMDLVMLVLVATAAAAAASIAEVGKHGNHAARWSPTCDKFEGFCNRGGWALNTSFTGAVLILILNMLSFFTAYMNACKQEAAA